MTHLLGIDLGTSSVKAVIVTETGEVRGVGQREYPILIPQPGYAEQLTADWWDATCAAVREATAKAWTRDIAGIGFSGQMHGCALFDTAGAPVGNAIIWPDQRSRAEVDEITELIGKATLAQVAGTAPAAGFMAATLLWMRKHTPEVLDRANVALTPKDALRYYLTGEAAMDPSDGSATGLFDVRARDWSPEIIDALGLPMSLFPKILQSADRAGELTRAAAEALGLAAGIPVAMGCADQCAQALGNGLLDPGRGSITLGTGGQVFAPLAAPDADPHLRLHTFCHAPPDRWYLLGASLSAGLSLRWLRDTLALTADPTAYDQLANAANEVPPGADGLLFLPYLVGERSPLMDAGARGAFIGLTLGHGRGHLARAVMEGVAFGLRQIVDLMLSLGAPLHEAVASGNGLASPIWRQIVADVLGRPLRLASGTEKAGVGAALLGGMAAGVYSNYGELRSVVQSESTLTEPDSVRSAFYAERYETFLELYPLLKPTFHRLTNG